MLISPRARAACGNNVDATGIMQNEDFYTLQGSDEYFFIYRVCLTEGLLT